MTDAITSIHATARRAAARIALSEGTDPRVVEGALRAKRDGLASPVLVGDLAAVSQVLQRLGAAGDALEIVDPARSPDASRYAEAYHELRRHKGVDAAAALRAVAEPLTFAALMVRLQDADGTVGGAVATTADTVRTALQVIGRAPGVNTVSSFFLMLLEADHHSVRGALAFADCGLIVEPSTDELAQIAASTADSFQALTGEVPRVAMLSFSTHGSAEHERVDRVTEATARVRAARPGLVIDGELQFDAAFVPAVAARKASASPLEGAANVFVFPGLEAANIGYKIAQRIGGAMAIGPILQGLARPANDLSRGCSADDVQALIAVTAAQSPAAR